MPPRSRQQVEEVYGPYETYLHVPLWPSIRNGMQDPEIADVTEMAPQHAAAALAKLVRWARREPTGQLSMIDDIDMREEEARTSPLGRHLAARALSLSEPQMHALFGDVGQGASQDPHVTAAEMVVAMGERFPDWALAERIELSMYLAGKLDARFVIKERKT